MRLDATFRRTDRHPQHHGAARRRPRPCCRRPSPRHAEHLNRELDSMLSGFDELIAVRIIDARGGPALRLGGLFHAAGQLCRSFVLQGPTVKIRGRTCCSPKWSPAA